MLRKRYKNKIKIISEAKNLKIRLVNKLNEIEEIITEINKLEKEKDLDCINIMEIFNGYEKLAQIV